MNKTYSVDTWFERNRASVIVYEGEIGEKVIAEMVGRRSSRTC